MPTIPQEISQSTQTLTDNAAIVEQFAQGAANTFIPVRGGTLRPLLYWQSTFQNKVTELAQPYVEQLIQANQVADSKVQAASDSAADANQSAQQAAASAASVDFPTRLAELNAQQTRLARSLSIIGDHGQSMHMDLLRQAFALGNLEGLNRTLSFAELFPDFTRESPKRVCDASGTYVAVAENEIAFDHDLTGAPLGVSIERGSTNALSFARLMQGGNWVLGSNTSGEYVDEICPFGSGFYRLTSINQVGNTFLRWTESVTSGSTWTFSALIRTQDVDDVYKVLSLGRDGAAAANNTIRSVEIPEGEWFWAEINYTVPEGANSISSYIGFDWNVGGIIDVAFCQLEPGYRRTSPIITDDYPLTRAADNLGRLMGDEYRQNRGTVWLDFDITPPGIDSGALKLLRLFDNSASGSAVELRYINSVAQFDVLARNNGVTTIDTQQSAYVDGVNSVAFAWDESGIYLSANGSGAVYNSGAVPTSITNLLFLEDVSGYLRSLLFIPTTLPEKLQELTSA